MSDQRPQQMARREIERVAAGTVFACRIHNPSPACRPRLPEQARPVWLVASRQRCNPVADCGRPAPSRCRHRLPKRFAYMGPEPATSSACSLRCSGGRYGFRSVLLDSSTREILSAREGAGESLPRQVRGRPTTIIWFRQAILLWRTQGACGSATVPRVRPLATPYRLGGLREEAIPRARACAAIPSPLHASGGHLKPPSGVL